jgi:type II secretory pathway component PulF
MPLATAGVRSPSIPSASPAERKPVHPVLRALLTAAATGLMMLHGIVLLIIVPRYQEIFTDFGTVLPGISRAIFALSSWVTGSTPGQVVPGALALALAVPLAAACLWILSGRRGGAAFTMAFIFAMVLLLALTGLAIYLPMHDMIESVQPAP